MNEKERHPEAVHYELQLRETEAGIGYFSCVPADDPDMETCIAHLRACPNDEFMRRHLMGKINLWNPDEMAQQIRKTDPGDKTVLSLFCDTCLLNEKFKDLLKYFPKSALSDLSRHSPLIYLKSAQGKDRELHQKWIQVFADNILSHRPIRPPDQIGLAPLFTQRELSALPQETISITQVREKLAQNPIPDDSPPRPQAKETIRRAMNRLARIRILAGGEMRHEASLSPIALLRKWKMNVSVQNGRHSYCLSGIQTSYGRGLDLEPARAAYMMEMIERYSSFASFGDEGTVGYEKSYPLTFGTYSSLKEKGFQILNPNDLALEAPYRDEALYWLEGEVVSEKGYIPMLVPAQCVFLFCNLDEAKLFSGLGSTGLASGNTLAEAKVSALTEVIERHCEGVTPFNPAQCFDIETGDPLLSKLLNMYAESGIRVQFQDLTSDMGIPCCKCFVMTQKGQIIKGTGANLNARQSLISALTETPYPFLKGEASGYGLSDLMRVPVENLPDYGLGSAEQNLHLLETLLTSNGYNPVYVNLTRKDTGIPVVRAIVPGMEITADFSLFSRVHPRLYASYLKMFA